MRPIVYTVGTYAAPSAIFANQAISAGEAAVMTGVSGGVNDPFLMDIPRPVLLVMLSAQTGRRFLVHGAGVKGNEIFESLIGTASGTVQSVGVFTKIYSIRSETTIAGGLTGVVSNIVRSPWFPIGTAKRIMTSLYSPAGTTGLVDAKIQVCEERLDYNESHGSRYDIHPPALTPFEPAIPVTLSGPGEAIGLISSDGITAIRAVINSSGGPITAGSVTLRVVQGSKSYSGV